MIEPLILSFDSSGPHCAVALLRGEAVLAERVEAMAKGQAERLMPLIEEVVAEAELPLSALDAIGVGVGPGNFTGIRIAVSAARGLALALGVPAVGVTSLEALALGVARPAVALVDARQGRVYFQLFHGDGAAAPLLLSLDEIEPHRPSHDVRWVGAFSEECAALGGVAVGPSQGMAVAIGRITGRRYTEPDLPRPAPLYLRAADAAPSKETGPVMLL